MSRLRVAGLLVASLPVFAQDRPTILQGDANKAEQLPPEEDNAQKPKEYSFNPLQSKKEVTVGEFYVKKGDFRAAATRFREATKWNDGNPDAWLHLGEAAEKNNDFKEAREAYEKYLELTPAAKNAAEIKKRIGKLP